MTTAEAQFEFGPRPRRGFLGLSKVQCATLAIALILGMVLMRKVGGLLGVPVGVVVGGLIASLILVRREGFPLTYWSGIVLARVVGQSKWLFPVASGRTTPVTVPGIGTAAVKVDTALAWMDDGAPVGLLDITAPASFSLAGSGTRAQATNGWAAALASLSDPTTLVDAVSWTVRVGPADAAALPKWAEGNVVADAKPELVASYQELMSEAGPVGQAHAHTIAVRLRNDRKARKQSGVVGGTGTHVSGETGRQAKRLDDVGVVATKIKTVDAVRDRVVSHLNLLHSAPHGAVAMAIEDKWDHVRVDDAFWRVFWIEEWPSVPVAADFLSPVLLGCRAARVMTLIAEAVPADEAARNARLFAGGQESDAEMRSDAGIRLSAEKRREVAAAQQREEELTEGHALMRFTGLIAICSPSLAALEGGTHEIVAAASQARLQLRTLYGQQAAALGSALPLARKVMQ